MSMIDAQNALKYPLHSSGLSRRFPREFCVCRTGSEDPRRPSARDQSGLTGPTPVHAIKRGTHHGHHDDRQRPPGRQYPGPA